MAGERILHPSGARIILPDGSRKIATELNFSCGCCGSCEDLLGGNPRLRVVLSVATCPPQSVNHTFTCEPPPGPPSVTYSGTFTPLDISGAYTLGFQQPPGSFLWQRTFPLGQIVMTHSISGFCGSPSSGNTVTLRADSITVRVNCDQQGRVSVGASVSASLVSGGSIQRVPCGVQNFDGQPVQSLAIPGLDGGWNVCPHPSADFPGEWDCGSGGHASGSATIERLP